MIVSAPSSKFFLRQRSLFHVLHSFSLHCTDCGYVQGMGPIAATLLCYFEPERVYASLVRLHDAYAMHRIFSPGFPGLLEALYVQERITEQTMPEVYAAFKGQMISTTSYATKWYITLFANSVPFQTQLRLWDIFLLEGQDVFVAVAVAIVWVYRGTNPAIFCWPQFLTCTATQITSRRLAPISRPSSLFYLHFSFPRTRTPY